MKNLTMGDILYIPNTNTFFIVSGYDFISNKFLIKDIMQPTFINVLYAEENAMDYVVTFTDAVKIFNGLVDKSIDGFSQETKIDFVKRYNDFLKDIDNNKKNAFVSRKNEIDITIYEKDIYDALNTNKNFHNEYTPLLVENAYNRYRIVGGNKSIVFFENGLDRYLLNGHCGY